MATAHGDRRGTRVLGGLRRTDARRRRARDPGRWRSMEWKLGTAPGGTDANSSTDAASSCEPHHHAGCGHRRQDSHSGDRRPTVRGDVDRELSAFGVALRCADRQAGFGLEPTMRPPGARIVGSTAMPYQQQKKRVESDDQHENDDEREMWFRHGDFLKSSDDSGHGKTPRQPRAPEEGVRGVQRGSTCRPTLPPRPSSRHY